MLQDGEKGVIIQRDKQSYAVAPHIPCGVVSGGTLRKLADVAEKYNAAALKITSAARIAIVGIDEKDVDAIWAELGMSPGFAVGLCVRSVKACPGTTFCKRGIQDSLALGLKLDEKYHGLELPGKLKIGVSGCPNQCAETCIKDIGLVGMPKGWRLLVGGNGGAKPRLSKELAKDITAEEAIELVEKIIEYYKDNARPHQRLGSMIEKMDFDEFKAAILGDS
jgi:NAD(P)H-nitrite reductase large subunit